MRQYANDKQEKGEADWQVLTNVVRSALGRLLSHNLCRLDSLKTRQRQRQGVCCYSTCIGLQNVRALIIMPGRDFMVKEEWETEFTIAFSANKDSYSSLLMWFFVVSAMVLEFQYRFVCMLIWHQQGAAETTPSAQTGGHRVCLSLSSSKI